MLADKHPDSIRQFIDDVDETTRYLLGSLRREPLLPQLDVAPLDIHVVTEQTSMENQPGIAATPADSAENTAQKFPEPCLQTCTDCDLHMGRSKTVEGRGSRTAKVVFVSDFPNDEEDQTGKPFAGRAGEMLQRMVVAMQLQDSDVYFTKLIKCKPPRSRKKIDEAELETCERHFVREIEEIQPRVIVAMGELCAQLIFRTEARLFELRGKTTGYYDADVMVTYAPWTLLEKPDLKKPVWADLQKVMKMIGK